MMNLINIMVILPTLLLSLGIKCIQDYNHIVLSKKESHCFCESCVRTDVPIFDGTTDPNIFLDWLHDIKNYFIQHNFTSTEHV